MLNYKVSIGIKFHKLFKLIINSWPSLRDYSQLFPLLNRALCN